MNGRGLVVRVIGAALAIGGIFTVSQQEGGVTPMLVGGMVMIGLGAVLMIGGDGR